MKSILLLFTLAVAARTAFACTEVVLKDKCTNSTVSSRTLSFPASLNPDVSLVRAGAEVALSEVGGTLDAPVWAPYPGKSIKSKYNFVCASMGRTEVSHMYGPRSARSKSNWLGCVDGLNDAGLSCSLQYQALTSATPSYDAADKSKPDALNIEDMCAFALARFDSAPALQEYIRGNLALVYPVEIYGEWARAMTEGKHDVPPFHYSITDASGRGVVVQVRDGVVQALDSKYGVFTNEPFLQEQEKNVEEFERQMLSNPAGVYPSVKSVPELAAEKGSDKPAVFLPLPGDYSGLSRFTRMALTLKYATAPTCWSADSLIEKGQTEKLNPAYIAPGLPHTNQALLAAMGITNQGYLPRGVDDDGLLDSAVEWTPFSTVRDHNLKTYYLRVANSPLYRAYDMPTINWANAGEGGIVTAPLTTPEQTWFVKEGL